MVLLVYLEQVVHQVHQEQLVLMDLQVLQV